MKKCLMTAMLAATCTASAETYYVSPDGNDTATGTSWETAKRTIQAAINATKTGDKVVVTDGTYTPITVTDNRFITIESVNGADATIIDGGGTSRCAELSAAPTHTKTLLTGFTLKNGYTPGCGGGAYYGTLSNCTLTANSAGIGGGSFCSTLYNCTLTGNTATKTVPISSFGFGGGGAYGGTLNNCTLAGNTANFHGGGSCFGTLNNCLLTGNTTANRGGGVYGATLNNCTLMGNTANGHGGGVYHGTLNNCTLTNNTARENGGGAYNGMLNNCLLAGNTARRNGGGAYNGMLNNCTFANNVATNGGGVYHGGGTNSTCTLNNCTLTGNTAINRGGGSYDATLNNCLLAGNTAKGNGGGAYNGNLNNCTLASNRASDGGGVYRGGDRNSTCILTNCIVWGNVTTSGNFENNYATYNSPFPVQFFKTYTKPLPYRTLPPDKDIKVPDPCFVDAANGNFRLQEMSPCIGRGSTNAVVGVCDLDGKPRIQDGKVDLGAYQFQVEPTVP